MVCLFQRRASCVSARDRSAPVRRRCLGRRLRAATGAKLDLPQIYVSVDRRHCRFAIDGRKKAEGLHMPDTTGDRARLTRGKLHIEFFTLYGCIAVWYPAQTDPNHIYIIRDQHRRTFFHPNGNRAVSGCGFLERDQPRIFRRRSRHFKHGEYNRISCNFPAAPITDTR